MYKCFHQGSPPRPPIKMGEKQNYRFEMNLISIRYKSTRYYFINTGNGLLAFDAGWPDTYRDYKECLKREGYGIGDIKWLIVSHFHMDHAGLAGMLADKGITFYVFENQLYGIEEMESLILKKNMPYHRLDRDKIEIKQLSESRNVLSSIGIAGEVIQTHGHGHQHVSLVLDSGVALVGDLAPEGMVADNDQASKSNWRELRSRGARIIKPAHIEEFNLE